MAAETLALLAPALAQTFAPDIVRTWNRTAVLAKSLRSVPGVGQGGGKNVAWDVEYSGATANSFAEGSAIAASEFNYDPVTTAILPWGLYRSAFSVSTTQLAAAAANIGSASALGDMVGERFMGAVTKLISRINQDIFSGTGVDASGNPTIVGLDTALQSSGIYAGINKGTVTEWAGNVSANAGTLRPLTLEILAGAERLVYNAAGKEIDAIFCTPAGHAKYESLFNDVVRIPNDGGGPIRSFQGSSKNLFWRGNPVVRDKQASANTFYMLNTSEVELPYLPFPGSAPDRGMLEARGLPSSNGADFEQTPLMAHCRALGLRGSAYEFYVEMHVQLRVKRPNEHALIKDITE